MMFIENDILLKNHVVIYAKSQFQPIIYKNLKSVFYLTSANKNRKHVYRFDLSNWTN